MAQQRVTQADISKRTGVSQATVSYVLSGKDHQVSPEIREKVLGAARKIGYFQGRHPAKSSQGLVAILLRKSVEMNSEFHIRCMLGIQQRLAEAGCLPVYRICESGADISAISARVSGCILRSLGNDELAVRLSRVMPVVILDDRTELQNIDCVEPDNYEGIRQAMVWLHERGHRKFSFLGIRPFVGPHQQRYEAFLRVHQLLGLPQPRPEWVCVPVAKDRSFQEMHELIRAALRQLQGAAERPTALICPADGFAADVVRYAPEYGVRIPQDLSVTGFDNAHLPYLATALSTVEQPYEEMGREAARLLLERIARPDLPVRRLMLAVSWLPRDSSGDAPSEE